MSAILMKDSEICNSFNSSSISSFTPSLNISPVIPLILLGDSIILSILNILAIFKPIDMLEYPKKWIYK